ncbi:hypothetical protein ACIGW1_32615 [Streptomyces sp. NPDC053780]|uniref:hypothetical protein n=1 Tax=unclassified Streptomyces TaxID=2593676 RepID=UPI00342B5E83
MEMRHAQIRSSFPALQAPDELAAPVHDLPGAALAYRSSARNARTPHPARRPGPARGWLTRSDALGERLIAKLCMVSS